MPTDKINNAELNHKDRYTYLKVISLGKFAVSLQSDNTMYRMWTEKNKVYFEFNSHKVRKYINNRNTLIDPFCEKDSKSIEPSLANEIVTLVPGELDTEYTVKTKAKILYK